MLIVAGRFEVEADRREQFIADRADSIRNTRGESGCLEYVMSADPIEPDRVVLFERWADQASLDAHLAVIRGAAPPAKAPVPSISAKFAIFDVAGERSLGG